MFNLPEIVNFSGAAGVFSVFGSQLGALILKAIGWMLGFRLVMAGLQWAEQAFGPEKRKLYRYYDQKAGRYRAYNSRTKGAARDEYGWYKEG